MFSKLKNRIKYLEDYVANLEERLQLVETELDNKEYQEWKSMTTANRDTAAKQGYWYLNSKADVNLLEEVIQRINENEDLTALFRTADGATLSLRVHKQPQFGKGPIDYGKFSEEE